MDVGNKFSNWSYWRNIYCHNFLNESWVDPTFISSQFNFIKNHFYFHTCTFLSQICCPCYKFHFNDKNLLINPVNSLRVVVDSLFIRLKWSDRETDTIYGPVEEMETYVLTIKFNLISTRHVNTKHGNIWICESNFVNFIYDVNFLCSAIWAAETHQSTIRVVYEKERPSHSRLHRHR